MERKVIKFVPPNSKKARIIKRLRREKPPASEAAQWPILLPSSYPKIRENRGLRQRIQEKIQTAIERIWSSEMNVMENIDLRRSDPDILVSEVRRYVEECLESRGIGGEVTINVARNKAERETRSPGYITFQDFQGIRKRAEIIKKSRKESIQLRKKDAGLFIPAKAQDALHDEGFENVMGITSRTLGDFLEMAYSLRVEESQ